MLNLFKSKKQALSNPSSHMQPQGLSPEKSLLDAISSQTAMIQFEPDGTILEANQNFLQTMGYDANEIIGQHHRIFCTQKETSSEEYSQFWSALANGEVQKGQILRVKKNGDEVWLEASYCPVRNELGAVDRIIKVASDITSFVNETHELRSQREALSRVQAIIEFDLEGKVLTANDNFLNTTGYQLENIQGQHHRMFCPEKISNSLEYKQFWESLRSGQFVAGKFERIDRNGETLWLEASYNPIFDPKGQLYKVIKFATDITESEMRSLRTSQLAKEASSVTETSAIEGKKVGDEAINVMQDVVSGLEGASVSIQSLNEQSDRISNIVSTITGIADQTNLLALNAAIEAARAGEQGRGFAVVADEVRQLAARTSNSTAEIDEVVKRNVLLSNEATSSMDKVVEISTKGKELIQETGNCIEQINASTQNLLEALHQK